MVYLKTSEGCNLKTIVEIIKNISTDSYVNIKDRKLFITARSDESIIVQIKLLGQQFTQSLLPSEEMTFSFVNSYLYDSLKIISKKDDVELYIRTHDPSQLYIGRISRDNKSCMISKTNIQPTTFDCDCNQNENQYQYEYSFPSSEMKRIVSPLLNLGKFITISMQSNGLCFEASKSNTVSRSSTFGTFDIDDKSAIIYSSTFEVQQLKKLIKIASFGDNIILKCNTDEPICIQTNIGTLGTISAYVKPYKI